MTAKKIKYRIQVLDGYCYNKLFPRNSWISESQLQLHCGAPTKYPWVLIVRKGSTCMEEVLK